MKLGILHLRLSRGLDARRCRLHRRRSVMPWWRRGSYATKDPTEGEDGGAGGEVEELKRDGKVGQGDEEEIVREGGRE